MGNKKYFAAGLLLGVSVMLFIGFASIPLRSRIMWGTFLPPEAKILEIYSILNTHSIIPVDKSILLDNMYRGLLEGVGDPYTYYFNREALEVFMERNEGSYAGVGMVVTFDTEDNKVSVVTVFSGSPADEIGMLPGDKIVEVDGENMVGRRVEEVTSRVRGQPGTVVHLHILRGGDMLDKIITRQQVQVPTVSHQMLDGGIGHLRIESFDGVTAAQFSEAYFDLQSQNMNGLIIDLRNNTGGQLQTVVYIANLILPEGVILYTEDNSGERTEYRSLGVSPIDVPLVILVNNSSASASEVLAGAVRDHGVGTIVGQQTFGKGVVQRLIRLLDGSAVKVTTSKYFTPSGVSIHGYGIEPDYIVEVDDETAIMAARLEFEDDMQLQESVRVIRGKSGA